MRSFPLIIIDNDWYIYSIISVWTQEYLFHGLVLSFILLLKLSQLWPLGAPSSWLLCPFDFPQCFLETLFSGTTKCSWIVLYFLCPSPISPRSQVPFIGKHLETTPWFVFLKQFFKWQDKVEFLLLIIDGGLFSLVKITTSFLPLLLWHYIGILRSYGEGFHLT